MKRLLLGLLMLVCTTPVFGQVEASQTQAEAGTAGWPYVLTPRRGAQAIAALTTAINLTDLPNWFAGTDYAEDATVSHNGVAWFAQTDPTTGEEPGVANDWTRIGGPDGPTGATGAAGAGYNATSTTELTSGTGVQTFTISAVGAYAIGTRIRLASAADPTIWMEGPITDITGTTVEVTVDKFAPAGGAASDWNISVTGEPGAPGVVQDHGTAGATETFDAAVAQVHDVVLAENITINLSFPNDGFEHSMLIRFTQDATGTNTVAYAAGDDPVGANPIIGTDADTTYQVVYSSPDGGTTIYASGGESGSSDPAAIHDNAAGEITAVTEKVTVVGNDAFLIEDSADSDNKKSAKLSAVRTYIKTGLPHVFALTIDNVADSMDYGIAYVPAAFTISEMVFVHSGTGLSSPDIDVVIRQGTDRSAAGTAVVTAGTTVTSSTTGTVVTSFDDATVVADSFLWAETSSRSGTTDNFEIYLIGTFD